MDLYLNNKCVLIVEKIIESSSSNEIRVNNSLIMKNLKKLFANFGIELLEHIAVFENGAISITESGMIV